LQPCIIALNVCNALCIPVNLQLLYLFYHGSVFRCFSSKWHSAPISTYNGKSVDIGKDNRFIRTERRTRKV